MKKIYKCFPAILFVAFIVTMMVLFFVLPKQEYSASQKRYLAKMPELTFENFNSDHFNDDFEKYLADHTPGVDFFVGLSAYYNVALGNTKSHGIYQGGDGYLIREPEDMSKLMRNVGFIEEFAEHTQIPVTVLVAPSTGYICADKLPLLHDAYTDEEMFLKMNSVFSKAQFVDVRETFKREYAAGKQIYYRTDHHWTTLGAYTAYCELGEALGYEPNGADTYHVNAYPDFYGTSYSSSGYWLTPPDEIEVWDNENNDVEVTITDDGETKQKDMFFLRHLEKPDKYEIFLDGNHPYTVIENKNASSDGTLLVVKDSFAHSLTPFLADHYAKIIMVDMRYYAMPLQATIEREGVDRVLFLYSINNLATDTSIAYIE